MIYNVGDKYEIQKHISRQDVAIYAELTGDRNMIHLDESYAGKTIFGKPIVHGMFCAGLISRVIADELPGEGTIYLGQELRFHAPVYHDELVTVGIEISDIITNKRHLILSTTVKNEKGAIAISGSARVKVTDLEEK